MRIIDVRCRVTVKEAGSYFADTAKKTGRFHFWRDQPLIDQIRAISKERIQKRLDRLEPAIEAELRALIVEMYGT